LEVSTTARRIRLGPGLATLLLLLVLARPLPAGAAAACLEAPTATRQAVRTATLEWALVRYPELVQDVRVVRVCGDWALAVLVPRERTEPAAVVLRLDGEAWRVVAGPGTAWPPDARPADAPASLFGDEPDLPLAGS
jgi:hypothetical protein